MGAEKLNDRNLTDYLNTNLDGIDWSELDNDILEDKGIYTATSPAEQLRNKEATESLTDAETDALFAEAMTKVPPQESFSAANELIKSRGEADVEIGELTIAGHKEVLE